MPKVSVIVPIYRVEKYIERCAVSLFEQTFDDIEYVFVNDCTKDNSMIILEEVLSRYPSCRQRTIIVDLPKNSGLSAARMCGLQFASGEYVVHCDSDDWVDVTMVDCMYKKMTEESLDLLFCDMIVIKEGCQKFVKKKIANCEKGSVFRRVLTESILNGVFCTMAKRTLYSNVLRPEGDMSEDKVIVLQLVHFSSKIGYLMSPLYFYNKDNDNSITSSLNLDLVLKRYWELHRNREVISRFAKQENLLELYKREFDAFFFNTKNILYPYVKNDNCLAVWEKSYPMSLNKIMFNPYILLREKIRYVLVLIRCLLVGQKK